MSNKKSNKKTNKTNKPKSQTTAKVETKKDIEKETISKVEKKEVKKVTVKEERTTKAKRKNFISATLISLLVLAICVISLLPLFKETKFGLDLQGGFEILYKVSSTDGSEVTDDMINSTYKIISKRIDILGVNEPEISIEGDNIRIQLAGVTDETEAKSVLSQMANLTFRNSKDELVMTSSVLKPGSVKVARDPESKSLEGYMLVLEIADIDTFHKQTSIIRENNDVMVIWLDYEEGVDKFATEQAKCGTSSDSRCISYASIQDELTGESVQLTGSHKNSEGKYERGFEQEEAQQLADLINSGSLPTKLEEISSRTVNASFGEDALQKTFIAGIVGIAAIMLLLIVIYRFSGFIASIGIVAYTALVFLIFNLIGGRLTLPGIAAVVIGIGMAVDACVISFARIKEELRNKVSLEEALKNGNKNSITSIMDANITTLIAAIILFALGESSVKGFATMLIISIVVTILVMVLVVRWMLNMFVKSGFFNNRYKAFLGIKNLEKRSLFERINYVKHLPKFAIATIVILVAGGVYFYQNGFNLGIDFAGGSSISITANDKIKAEDIEKDIKYLGYKVAKVEAIDENTVYVTVRDVFDAEDNDRVTTYLADKYEGSTTSIGSVSNIVKKQLLENAIKSLVYACIGLIIYVTLRFTFNYGISSVTALIHDVAIVCILFSLLKLEVTTIYIAAILSIIGYSINNTIVVFDRIRENRKKLYKGKLKNNKELYELVNVSLQETTSRTILTTITTLLPVVALIVLGSHEIVNFNYALLFGLIAGSYSSLLLSTSVWLFFEKRKVGKPEKKKWYEVDDDDKVEELKVKGINC